MHIMKLNEKYFNYIKGGSKIYEIRLNDEKRKNIKNGDLIEFQKEPLKIEKIICEVEELLYFNNFNELTDQIDIKLLASYKETKTELLTSLNNFYSEEDQNKFGVVAIKINKNFIIEKKLLSNIDINNKIFDNLKDNYIDFDNWYKKLINSNEECYFTKNNNEISSLLILKINENDSQQLKNKNLLKIRLFNVIDKNKGIGSFYIKIINDIAKDNNIKVIYATCKKNREDFITFIKKYGFSLEKIIDDELIFIKEIV